MGMPDEGHKVFPGLQISLCNFEITNVTEPPRLFDFSMNKKNITGFNRQWHGRQELFPRFVQLTHRPFDGFPGVIIEDGIIHHPHRRGIVISHHEVSRHRPNSLKNFDRLWPISHHITQTNNLFDIAFAEIRQNRFPGGKVGVNV